MANTTNARNSSVNGMGKNADPPSPWISLHSADPGTSGAGELVGGTYQRVSVTFPDAAGGSTTSTTAVVNVPANAAPTHWGRWSQQTGGQFFQGFPLNNSEQYSAAGGTYSIVVQLTQPAGT